MPLFHWFILKDKYWDKNSNVYIELVTESYKIYIKVNKTFRPFEYIISFNDSHLFLRVIFHFYSVRADSTVTRSTLTGIANVRRIYKRWTQCDDIHFICTLIVYSNQFLAVASHFLGKIEFPIKNYINIISLQLIMCFTFHLKFVQIRDACDTIKEIIDSAGLV